MYRFGWPIMALLIALFVLMNPLFDRWYLLHIPSLVWCVGMVFGVILVSQGGWHDPLNLGDASKKKVVWHDVWKTATIGSWAFGRLGTLIFLIHCFAEMRPETVGSGLAQPFIPLLYGGIMAECIFRPLSVRARFAASCDD